MVILCLTLKKSFIIKNGKRKKKPNKMMELRITVGLLLPAGLYNAFPVLLTKIKIMISPSFIE
jgi:hypothetical protein